MGKTKVELNGKTILVTGSPGFVGANLVIRLLKEMTDGTIYWTLKVKVKFTQFGPNVFIKLDDEPKLKMDEETIGELDELYISRFDMDIRAYDWEVSGKSGRTAYLDGACAYRKSRSNRFMDDEPRFGE